MSDEFQLGSSGNWWDGTRNRYDSSGSTVPTSSTALNSFGWQAEMVDMKAAPPSRSSMDSVSVSGSSNMGVFAADSSQRLHAHESSSSSGAAGLLADPNLHMMGLGLSSHQTMDWSHQPLFRGEKAESSFRSMLQAEDQGSANFQQDSAVTANSQEQWRQKLFGDHQDSSSSITTDFKQFNRGLSLDQSPPQQYSSHTSSTTNNNNNFQVDSSSVPYGSPPNVLFQGLLVSDTTNNQSAFDHNRSINNYSYVPSSYADQLIPSNSWSNKFPQFLRASPPKQQQPPPPHGHLHFSNNTPFWNASTAGAINDQPSRSSFFTASLQSPVLATSTFEEKPKQNTSEVRELAAKKSSTEAASNKRSRNETTPSPMPAFKVRKEKMGDRITALQQLVSPFGKTDTASVLTEAIEYIKFLHEQISVLSTPYMKSGAHIQHPQAQIPADKSNKDPAEGPKQDLRSRGLCLVPVPSTFPVINESNFDFWNPTFGGTYR